MMYIFNFVQVACTTIVRNEKGFLHEYVLFCTMLAYYRIVRFISEYQSPRFRQNR